jgi:plastocyanin
MDRIAIHRLRRAPHWGAALHLGRSLEVSMPSATTGDQRGYPRCDERWLWKLCGLFAGALLLVAPAAANEDRAVQPQVETLEDLPELDPSVQMNTHKVVLITADALNPASVNLDPGQLIAWISYSPSKSTVVFERSVAKSMICHSRVNFSFEEGELRSTPINAGEFASFCQLKPGSYRYKVVRSKATHPSEGDEGQMLEGEIVVGEK